MSELYTKTMDKLELGEVLRLLSEQACSSSAKELCKSLQPQTDADEVRSLLAQTSAACHLISLKGSPGLSGIEDVSASLERADRGGALSAGELLRIARVLRCARTVKNYAETDSASTVLDVYFWELTGNKYLEEKIEASILSEEEIADSASSELADIRRHIFLAVFVPHDGTLSSCDLQRKPIVGIGNIGLIQFFYIHDRLLLFRRVTFHICF